MTLADKKIPKGWAETAGYRCYDRKMGPLVLRVTYSSSGGTFSAKITTAGFHWVAVHELVKDLEPASNMEDADVLRMLQKRAKEAVRGWAK